MKEVLPDTEVFQQQKQRGQSKLAPNKPQTKYDFAQLARLMSSKKQIDHVANSLSRETETQIDKFLGQQFASKTRSLLTPYLRGDVDLYEDPVGLKKSLESELSGFIKNQQLLAKTGLGRFSSNRDT